MKNMYTSVLSRWLMLLLLLSSQTLLAQTAPTIQWQRVLPGITEVKAVKTSNGDIITTNGSSVLKLSGATGAEQWKTTLPTTYQYSIGIDLASLPDGGVAVLARDPYKWLLIRLNASGTVQWLKPFRNITQPGEITQTKLTRVIQALDGGYIAMGSTQYGRDGSSTDLYRFDTEGNLVSTKGLGYVYPNAPRPISVGNSLVKISDGSYVVVGSTKGGTESTFLGWAVKLDSELNVIWQNRYDKTINFDDVIQAVDGRNYLVTGATDYVLGSSAGILAIDATGQLVQNQRSDTQTGDTYYYNGNASIVSLPGSVPPKSVLLTTSSGPSTNSNDFRLSTPGLVLSLGGSGNETASSLIATPDGGFLLAGTTTSTDGDVKGKTDNTPSGWLVKLAPTKPLTINAPTYDCSTGTITFNTSGGDGSPITFSAPGISRPSLTSITGTVEQGLRNDPKPIFIVANQSGQRTTYSFDLKAACSGTTPTPTMHPDMQPLVDLYNATNGPSWKNKTNWLTGNNPCNWFGVSCNADSRVIGINLGYNNLNGTLPASLGNLAELQRFIIFTEPLVSGTLPASLGNLSKLQLLEIEYTQISGSIPESLGNLKQLTQLFLAKNELSGSIPESLGNLSNLKTLYLFGNQLTGSLPNSFASLPQIQSLHLYANRFSGCIPSAYTALCGKDVQLSSNVGLPGGGDFAAFCANPSQNCGPNKLLTLTQPTYNCSTGAITFNFANGDGSPVTYTAPGITRSSVTSNSGIVEQGLRNDPKVITITGTQSGYSTSYSFDLKAACNGTTPTPTPTPPATGNALSLSAYVGNCASQTPLIAFKTTGGDGTPITFSAPGVVRRFPTDSSGTIESGLRNDPKPITISALQSGKSVSYVVDLPKICDPTPIIGKPLDNLTLTAGQGTYTIIAQSGINFYDPYVLTDITGHHARATYMSFRSTGLPDSLYAQNYDDGGNNYYFRLFGKPTTAGVYTVTVTATVNARSVSTTFTITVLPANAQPVTPTPPATGNTLTLTQPTYDCSTGAFTFNYTGGNGSPVEFQAAGITGWTTNPNQFVDKDSRTANDVKPFTLMARQNGQMVTYTWDLKAACGRSARMAATEAGQALELTVKGNPVGNTAVVEIRGAEGQAVSLDLLNASGNVLEQRHIEQAGAVDEQRFDLQRQPTGLLFLRAQSGQQKQTVKLIKQ